MKKMLFFLLILSLLLISCGKKEEVDEKFTEFTHKIDEDMQDLFEKKEAEQKEEVQEKEPLPEKKQPEEKAPVQEKEDIPEVAMVQPKEEKKPIEPVVEKEIPAKEIAELSTAELWNAYNQAKEALEKAKEQNQFENILTALQKTTLYSQQLNRDDIATWQLNNIGYYSIEEFKRRVNYDTRMNRLNQMPSGDEKRNYYVETKEIINKEFPLLKKALPYLKEAAEIDKNLDNENRTKIIHNNIQFIEFVSQAYVEE